nr:MMPL family transporter [Bacillota bacterium]
LLSDYEGDQAFMYYEDIQGIIDDLDLTGAHILGETAIAYQIKDTVSLDYNLVLVIALLSVMVIILITFRNLLMPFLLPLVIETSVFFTMALLYFLNNQMVFLATLIVSAILLGVTIDYAILLSKTYMETRETEDKKKSIRIAIQNSTPSVITSAMLFSISGLTISLVSSIQTIAQIGLIIAVGAVTSLFYVLIILPQLLSIFDKWICKSKISRN